MRKAVLIYNPASGQKQARRATQMAAVAAVLRQAGVEAEMMPTRAPGTAGEQAMQAIATGADAVLACGGDGTVHEVLQGVAGSGAALGIIPLGTANSLAVDIGLPREPAAAARALLSAEPVRIALGRLQYRDRAGQCRSRYFTVAAGVGADAHLMYKLDAAFKQRYGMSAYYAAGLRIWLRHPFPLFDLQFTAADGERRSERISQLLAVRIANFGGLLAHLAPGAALQSDILRLVLFKTQSRTSYFSYVTQVVLRRTPRCRGVEFVDAAEVKCSGAERIHVEADGEYLGTVPVSMDVVKNALTLLMPRRALHHL